MYNNVDDLRAPLQNAFVFVFLAFHINYFLQPLGRVHLFIKFSIDTGCPQKTVDNI